MSGLILGYDEFQSGELLDSFRREMDSYYRSALQSFQSLTSTFLNKSPVPVRVQNDQTYFSCLSERKDVHQQLRRFTMGVQPKGLHMKSVFLQVQSKMEHVKIARSLDHPIQRA